MWMNVPMEAPKALLILSIPFLSFEDGRTLKSAIRWAVWLLSLRQSNSKAKGDASKACSKNLRFFFHWYSYGGGRTDISGI